MDIVCYGKFGHNEIDEPSFTLPKMYKIIQSHPSALEIYEKKLLQSGQATKDAIKSVRSLMKNSWPAKLMSLKKGTGFLLIGLDISPRSSFLESGILESSLRS